jgi:hydrogenase/urease accessory protein HupE
LLPLAASAHPGHDGDHGGLTWDFVADIAHRLTSPYHLLPALALGGLLVLAWRKVRSGRAGTRRD